MRTRISYKFNNVWVLAGVSAQGFIGCHFDAPSEARSSYYSFSPASFCIVTITTGNVPSSGGFETFRRDMSPASSVFKQGTNMKHAANDGIHVVISQKRGSNNSVNLFLISLFSGAYSLLRVNSVGR
jgi:hypothetical protein